MFGMKPSCFSVAFRTGHDASGMSWSAGSGIRDIDFLLCRALSQPGWAAAVRRPSAPARADERAVRRGQGEEPEQLLPAGLREPPRALRLLAGEHCGGHLAASRQRPKVPGPG